MSHLLFTTLSPATPSPPERREVARKVASMTLAVALLGLVVLTTLSLIVLRRIRRRQGAVRARRTRHSDAWAEAGRRAGSPPPEAFEPDQPVVPDHGPNAGPDAGPHAPPRPPGDPHG